MTGDKNQLRRIVLPPRETALRAQAWHSFAAAALQGLMLRPEVPSDSHSYMVQTAAEIADAMLAEFDKRQ